MGLPRASAGGAPGSTPSRALARPLTLALPEGSIELALFSHEELPPATSLGLEYVKGLLWGLRRECPYTSERNRRIRLPPPDCRTTVQRHCPAVAS